MLPDAEARFPNNIDHRMGGWEGEPGNTLRHPNYSREVF